MSWYTNIATKKLFKANTSPVMLYNHCSRAKLNSAVAKTPVHPTTSEQKRQKGLCDLVNQNKQTRKDAQTTQ
eukprot:m.833245 g.833245  ORF g.833245 m.833245 type:complete len:72 (-) comp23442_c0_seq4:921-1136(-)